MLRRSFKPQADESFAWGEDLMAVEPSALRGFNLRQGRGADVATAAIEWNEHGLAQRGNVCLVQVEGPLSRTASWWSDGYDAILSRFEAAMSGPSRAVLPVIHSPGGYVSGLDACADGMTALKIKYGKPVEAIASDMAYSAAYRLACVADRIHVTKPGGLGSVGVRGPNLLDFSKAQDLAGIKEVVVISGAFKADGDPSIALTPEIVARFQERVDYQAGLFYSAVATSRRLTTEQVKAQQAALYLGPSAVESGLADSVASLDDVIKDLETKTSGRVFSVPATARNGQQQGKARMDQAMLAVAIGLGAAATDEQVSERARGLLAMESTLREKTGKPTASEQLAVIDGWKTNADALGSVNEQLAQVRAKEEAGAFAALVAKGEADAKIVPANRAKALATYKDSAALGAWLETVLPALPGLATAGDKQPVGGGKVETGETALTHNGKAYKDLSFSERAAWKNADPTAWTQAKAEYDRQKGG